MKKLWIVGLVLVALMSAVSTQAQNIDYDVINVTDCNLDVSFDVAFVGSCTVLGTYNAGIAGPGTTTFTIPLTTVGVHDVIATSGTVVGSVTPSQATGVAGDPGCGYNQTADMVSCYPFAEVLTTLQWVSHVQAIVE